jgi:hypothetical protein
MWLNASVPLTIRFSSQKDLSRTVVHSISYPSASGLEMRQQRAGLNNFPPTILEELARI